MSADLKDNSDAILLSSTLSHLWVFGVNLIQLNVVSHEPLEHNVLESKGMMRCCAQIFLLEFHSKCELHSP